MTRLSDLRGQAGRAGLPRSNSQRDALLDGRGNLIGSFDSKTTGASTVALDLDPYETRITTGDTDGTENVTIGNGSTAIVGQRKLVTLETRVGTDTVSLDHANILNASGTQATNVDLDAAGEFVLLEYVGSNKWQVRAANATIAP